MKKIPGSLTVFLIAAIICGCGAAGEKPIESLPPRPETPSPAAAPAEKRPLPTEDPAAIRQKERAELIQNAAFAASPAFEPGFPVEEFLLWTEEHVYPGVLDEVAAGCGGLDFGDFLRENTKESIYVLTDRFYGLADDPDKAAAARVFFPEESPGADIVLSFGGDINLVEDGYVVPVLRAAANGLPDVLAGGLLERMRAADVLLLNNEFAFTTGGTALPGKEYVFRADPKNAEILVEMGADVVFLANNHVFDFGREGLSDTLKTLDDAGIARIGAGENIHEAAAPAYFIVKGRKIAYIGAGCIERYGIFTPGATENSPGIFRADEKNARLLSAVISEAVSKSDFTVVNIHWGVESTSVTEPYQRELGRICIDAGADAVIGNHPHVLQGAEFHKGKPIVYSTGNFWFSRTQTYSCLLELVLSGEDVTVRLVPCETGGGITKLTSGETAERINKYYENISFNVAVDADGTINDIK
ncbi:MAG: CapA family protein [Oscillospiraceae bacterium]|nr:CapA family protein [Oscillospiraceae bacterium]